MTLISGRKAKRHTDRKILELRRIRADVDLIKIAIGIEKINSYLNPLIKKAISRGQYFCDWIIDSKTLWSQVYDFIKEYLEINKYKVTIIFKNNLEDKSIGVHIDWGNSYKDKFYLNDHL